MAPAGKLFDELVGEILILLPPDDPACLLRASLVCKRWRRVLADPAFRRRRRALHRTPAVLGFLHLVDSCPPFSSRFVPIDPDSRRPARRDLPGWRVLDCRHGRGLFIAQAPGTPDRRILDFIVWDPLTDEQHRLPWPSPPPVLYNHFTAAVLCAAATRGCDHRDCHGGPFRVVFISSNFTLATGYVTSARVYSSETGVWSEPASFGHPGALVYLWNCFSTLVGDTIHFLANDHPISYQPDAKRLSVIDSPPLSMYNGELWFGRLVDDGGSLGFVGVVEEPSFCLRLLSRETSPDGVARWAQGRDIKLETLLPVGTLPPPAAGVIGIAEGTDAVFVYISTNEGGDVYMIHFNSGRAKKVHAGPSCGPVFPYTSFCIPVMDVASSGERPRTSVLGT